jgi:hypothetical protein
MATTSTWSPINDVNTPVPGSGVTTAALPDQSQTPGAPASQGGATPFAALDISKLPNPLPDSLKGYELVSWQVGQAWNFTLVTATNSQKTFEELMKPDSEVTSDGFVKITVSGVDQIKKVLGLLPKKSQVFWGGMDLSGQVPDGTAYFSFPPAAIMNSLADYCAQKGINLISLAEPQ